MKSNKEESFWIQETNNCNKNKIVDSIKLGNQPQIWHVLPSEFTWVFIWLSVTGEPKHILVKVFFVRLSASRVLRKNKLWSSQVRNFDFVSNFCSRNFTIKSNLRMDYFHFQLAMRCSPQQYIEGKPCNDDCNSTAVICKILPWNSGKLKSSNSKFCA